ncbi:vWA domain-containing protein [Halomonas sp. E19]|uniref:vWA domain-containing protein n=1 Tax=Halomonas sp. E19 TaxID=3397247 RepID=UPI004033741A
MATYRLNPTSDLIDNPSPRCACMLVLDTSASMFGQPIQELNAGVQAFIAAIKEDEMAACSVELGVITAGGKVTEQLPFTTAMHISQCRQFVASGLTRWARPWSWRWIGSKSALPPIARRAWPIISPGSW